MTADPPVQAPRVFTVDEIAPMLRVGRNAVYLAIQRGELHAYRVGRFLRVREDDLRAWLAACATTERQR